MSKFTKPFRGVPQGEIYPVQFAVGEDCPAELVAGALSVGALSLVDAPPPGPVLLGSNALPSQVPLTDGNTVPLGVVVNHAYEASQLSVEDWNALDEGVREAALSASLEQLVAEAEASNGDGGAGAAQADQKAELVRQLEAAGIAFDKRWGVEKLAAALAGVQKD